MLEISRAMKMLKIWWSLISIPRSAVQAEQIGMEVMEVIRDIKMPGWAVKELTPHSPTHLILGTDGGEFLFPLFCILGEFVSQTDGN